MSQIATKFITNNAATNAKIAQSPANTIKGNNTGSTANVLDLTVSQAQTLLSVPTTSAQLAVNAGGTGVTSTTAYAVLTGGTTSTGPLQSIASVGTSGQVLTSNGAGALPSFQPSLSALTAPYEQVNMGLSVSASSNILTIALKQADGTTDASTGTAAVRVAMRSNTVTSGAYNERQVTAALSLTLTQGTSLNMSTVATDVWIYLIDSDGAGTMKLGASTVLYDETAVVPVTVAESSSATATNASPAVFTVTAHNYNQNDGVRLTGTPPTGFTTGTTYYVLNQTTNTFQLTATPGGTAINSSSTGSAIVVHYAGFKMASDAVYTNKPIRLLGKFNNTFSTIGNWATPNSVSLRQLFAPSFQPVGARYFASSTSVSGSFSKITYTTLDYDTHNSYVTNTYIAPANGKYLVNTSISMTGTSLLGTGYVIGVFKNGIQVSEMAAVSPGAAAPNIPVALSDIINCQQGDLITVQALTGATGPSIVATNFRNYFSVTNTNN